MRNPAFLCALVHHTYTHLHTHTSWQNRLNVMRGSSGPVPFDSAMSTQGAHARNHFSNHLPLTHTHTHLRGCTYGMYRQWLLLNHYLTLCRIILTSAGRDTCCSLYFSDFSDFCCCAIAFNIIHNDHFNMLYLCICVYLLFFALLLLFFVFLSFQSWPQQRRGWRHWTR